MAKSILESHRDEPLLHDGRPDPAPLEVCLERIRASAEFVRSDRMVRMLQVIVLHALEKRGNRLTERQLGCEVFDRPADWDPSLDTIVRSEARRLRAKLDQYYERQGRLDPIRIHIPKGAYLAEFEMRETIVPSSTTSSDGGPGLARIARRPWLLTASVILLAAVGVLTLLLFRRSRDTDERFDVRTISSEIGTEYSPAISPDGSVIAYVWDDRQSGPDIYLRNWNDNSLRRLNQTPALRLYPSWSRDGRSLAYLLVEGEDVFIVVKAMSTGDERRIAQMKRQVGRWSDDASPLLGPPGPTWMPDDTMIVGDYDPATSVGSLVRVSMDGRRTTLLQSQGVDHYLYPRVSQDGKTLAFVRYTSHGVGELFTLPTAGGVPQQLTSDSKAIQGLSWSPDGRRILFSSNRRGNYQLWSIAATGGPIAPVPANSTSATDPVYISTGDILFVDSRENWNIWQRPVHAGAGAEHRLIASSGRNYDPRYSPDGHQIAFASDRTGTMELWLADSDGGQPQQMTHLEGSWLGGIAWSPDGKSIAFDARPAQRSAIYVIAAQGGQPHLIEANAFEERMPAWSKDGEALYFNSNRDGGLAVWRRQLSSGVLHKITSLSMFAVASDGEKLYLSARTGELWQSDLDGGHPMQLPGDLKADPVMS